MAQQTQNQNNLLDKDTLNKIKKELLERKKSIEKDLKDLFGDNGDGTPKFPEYGDKSDENAQEIDDYSTNLATDKVLEGTLKDINNALKSIEDGTYGICKYCHKPINPKRLLARPVASACIECKTKLQNS